MRGGVESVSEQQNVSSSSSVWRWKCKSDWKIRICREKLTQEKIFRTNFILPVVGVWEWKTPGKALGRKSIKEIVQEAAKQKKKCGLKTESAVLVSEFCNYANLKCDEELMREKFIRVKIVCCANNLKNSRENRVVSCWMLKFCSPKHSLNRLSEPDMSHVKVWIWAFCPVCAT